VTVRRRAGQSGAVGSRWHLRSSSDPQGQRRRRICRHAAQALSGSRQTLNPAPGARLEAGTPRWRAAARGARRARPCAPWRRRTMRTARAAWPCTAARAGPGCGPRPAALPAAPRCWSPGARGRGAAARLSLAAGSVLFQDTSDAAYQDASDAAVRDTSNAASSEHSAAEHACTTSFWREFGTWMSAAAHRAPTSLEHRTAV